MNTGWKLEPSCRAELLERFPARYVQAVADHVTYKAADGSDGPTLPTVATARIVGRADDGRGVEAMVVEINGTTDRADGSTWHVTWSLGDGRHAKESNAVIAALGWTGLDGGSLMLAPANW